MSLLVGQDGVLVQVPYEVIVPGAIRPVWDPEYALYPFSVAGWEGRLCGDGQLLECFRLSERAAVEGLQGEAVGQRGARVRRRVGHGVVSIDECVGGRAGA
jgi:hypothetical protein